METRTMLKFVVVLLLAVIATATVASESAPVIDNVIANRGTCVGAEGEIKCVGANNMGQLGYGDTTQRGITPSSVGKNLPYVDLGSNDGDKIAQLAMGSYGSCALLENKKVKCWGSGNNGELGYATGSWDNRGDNAGEMGDDLPYVDFGENRTVKALFANRAGSGSNCVILDNDKFKCWGYYGYGVLANGGIYYPGYKVDSMGDNLPFSNIGGDSKVLEIAGGYNYYCAIMLDGKVKCWGSNTGQQSWAGTLGQGNTISETGSEYTGDNLPYTDLGDGITAKHIYCGDRHCCVITNEADKIKCWGRNDYGQLGYEDINNRGSTATQMGENLPFVDVGCTVTQMGLSLDASCALCSNAKVKCWGRNTDNGWSDTYGDEANEMGANLPYLEFGSGFSVAKVVGGSQHTCVLFEDDKGVKCWGQNWEGQLGVGDTTAYKVQGGDPPFFYFADFETASPTAPPTPAPTTDAPTIGVPTNAPTTNAPTTEGLAAWGTNWHLSVNEYSSDGIICIIKAGKMKCWGGNNYGELGYGDQVSRYQLSQLGPNLPYVDLFGEIANVGVGVKRMCMVLTDGTAKCLGVSNWGSNGAEDNDATHLGINGIVPVTDLGEKAKSILPNGYGAETTCAVLQSGKVKCFGYPHYGLAAGPIGGANPNMPGKYAGSMGDNLPYLKLGEDSVVTKLVDGYYCFCGLLADGQVKCWGYNKDGHLGIGSTVDTPTLQDPYTADFVVESVHLGTGRTAVDVGSGQYHACALLDNSEVKCWGNNADGQLGQGSTTTLGDNPGEMGDALPPVDLGDCTPVSVGCGRDFSCVLCSNGKPKCWGNSDYIGIKLGDYGKSAGTMGKNLPFIDLGTGLKAVELIVRATSLCAIMDNGGIKCWGQNMDGVAGTGVTDTIGRDGNGMGDDLAYAYFAAYPTYVQVGQSGKSACRDASGGSKDSYYTRVSAVPYTECEQKCNADDDCKGFEYSYKMLQCELWNIEPASSAEVSDYDCYKKEMGQRPTPTATYSILGQENNGACRGKTETANSYGQFKSTSGSLEECQAKCTQSSTCSAVEYAAKFKRCELWGRKPGTTKAVAGYTCYTKNDPNANTGVTTFSNFPSSATAQAQAVGDAGASNHADTITYAGYAAGIVALVAIAVHKFQKQTRNKYEVLEETEAQQAVV